LEASTFVAPGRAGIGEVLGLCVTGKRRSLWAASLSDKETGAIVDDCFYFMANTQVDRFPSGTIVPGPPIKLIRMRRTKLE